MRSTLVVVVANKFTANKMLGLPQNTEKCLICSLQQQIFEYLLGAKYFFLGFTYCMIRKCKKLH